jgi:hypothetical protein
MNRDVYTKKFTGPNKLNNLSPRSDCNLYSCRVYYM